MIKRNEIVTASERRWQYALNVFLELNLNKWCMESLESKCLNIPSLWNCNSNVILEECKVMNFCFSDSLLGGFFFVS